MGNNNKGCKWLRFHAEQHAELCKVGKGAYLNCKETCDSCVVPSLLPSAVPSSLPSIPIASPTTCGDLNLATFTIKKYNDAGSFKSDIEGKKCQNLVKKNDITIQNNCAANTIIANDCKLTCDNCDIIVTPCSDDDSVMFPVSHSSGKDTSINNNTWDINNNKNNNHHHNNNNNNSNNNNNNNNKGCKWLRFHAEQHAELCKVGKGAYLNCKKTCDSCDVPSLLPSAVPSLLPSVSSLPSSLPSVIPSSLLSAVPSSLPSVPTASPTTCGDLNLATFTIKKYNDAGTFKSEKEGRKCKKLAEKNDITIQNNCAANTIIANDCKLTCDNCDNIVTPCSDDDSVMFPVGHSSGKDTSINNNTININNNKNNNHHHHHHHKGCKWLRFHAEQHA